MRAARVPITAILSSVTVDTAPTQGRPELARQVFAAESSFAAFMVRRDFAAFSSHVAEEAVFFGTSTVNRGKPAVLAAWRRYFSGADVPFSWTPEQVEVLESGTLALSSGPAHGPDGRQVGVFTSIWRLEADGRWRVVFDKGCSVATNREGP